MIPILFSLLCVSLCQPLQFKQREFEFDSEDEMFRYRSLITNTLSLLGYNGVWYHSLECDVSTKQPIADGNFIWGSIYIGRNSYPVNWQGFWGASVTYNRTIPDPNNINWEKFDVSFTSSFAAAAYLRLLEKDSTGKVVEGRNVSLASIWDYNSTLSGDLTNITAGIYASVFETVLGNGASVQLQYVLTEQSGILDVLDGVRIIPKAVETIVIIEDWPYAAESNTLSLVMAAASADVSASANGQLTSGSGDEATFFRLARQAQVDGEMRQAVITVDKSKDVKVIFQGTDVAVQLEARYSSSASAGVYSVQFAPGAKRIVYDPTLGSGEDPFQESDTGIIVGIVVGVLIAIIIVVAVILYFKRRRSYQSL